MEEEDEDGQPPAKTAKRQNNGTSDAASAGSSSDNFQKLLSTFGTYSLTDSGLKQLEDPTPETMLAPVHDAMTSSFRISHLLAARTVDRLIKHGCADFDKVEKSTWDERTDILAEGGCTRYRERTATQ